MRTQARLTADNTRHWLALFLLIIAVGCDAPKPQGKPMSPPTAQVSDETRRFHQVVEEGNLDELQAALKSGANVNAPGDVGMTALMLAIEAKDLEKTKLLIEHGADPEQTDDFNYTPLRRAVDVDYSDGVRLLLGIGVDRGYQPRYPLKKVAYKSMTDVPMPDELKETMTEAQWKESMRESDRMLREMRENPTVDPYIAELQSVEVLKLFLEAGDDLNLAPNEFKRALIGLESGGELRVAPSEYQKHRTPSYGTRNPERMDYPFWRDMIRTGLDAYSASEHFDGKNPSTEGGPVWCYDRFGSPLTKLADGRYVQVAGEHEDHYDPDFFIYNDVVIHDGKGDFQIYGYPKQVFPPTDFHTATLCPDGIYIIGCLGYQEQRREGFTPVYRLKLDSWQIESVQTTGDMPGWIYKHRARFDPESNTISIEGGEKHVVGADGEPQLVANEQRFELDLNRFEWRRVK